LISDPANVEQQLGNVRGILPQEALGLLEEQVKALASQSEGALSLGLIAGIFFSIWSAAKGTKGIITALNITYDEEESRSFFKLNGIALLLTIGALVFVLLALGLIVAVPIILDSIGLPSTWQWVARYLRWPALAIMVMLLLAALYRYAPDRDEPRWEWVSWGAVLSTFLWIFGSLLFSYYVANFGNYNKTYGSVGAVIILLMWFYLSAYVVLLGAELNAEMEHQTEKDTTKGQPEPMGARGAHVADTVGRSS
jgi:membrane protein